MTSRRASRARSSRGSAAPRPPPRRKSTSTASSAATSPPPTSRSSRSQPADLEEGGDIFLPAVLERWFGQTRSEWRRRIQQGGVSLDGEPVSDLAVPAAALAGKHLKAGKSAKAQGVIRGL